MSEDYFGLAIAALENLSWPLCVLAMLFLVRKKLVHILNLPLKRFAYRGFEFETHPTQPTSWEETAGGLVASTTVPPLENPIAIQLEERLRNDLQGLDPSRREAVVLRALTNSEMQRSFALIYANIYESQIRALELLQQGARTPSEAANMFDQLKKDIPQFEALSLPEYLNYLFHNRLISKDSVSGNYKITENGVEFLRYLAVNNLPRNRPF